jgi:hypothetical protein
MYADMLQINEPIRDIGPLLALTNNPNIRGIKVMAKSNVAHAKKKKQAHNKIPIEGLIGKRFGRLVVIDEAEPYISPKGIKQRQMVCRCDCGEMRTVHLLALRNGATSSCGCLHSEIISNIFKKHGYYKHPLYRVWAQMKSRCYNQKDKGYKNYGHRGIIVSDEWLTHPENFIEWAIANGWHEGLVIDREDNDGNYCAKNCRIIDYGLSGRNKQLLVSNNTSGYRGVSFEKRRNRWRAKIMSDGQIFELGLYKTPKYAAIAYDNKAVELDAGHPLNFPENQQ